VCDGEWYSLPVVIEPGGGGGKKRGGRLIFEKKKFVFKGEKNLRG